ELVVRPGVLYREPRVVGDAGEEANRAWREALRVHGDDAATPLALEMEGRHGVVRVWLGDAVDGRELVRADRDRLRDREERARDRARVAQSLRLRSNLVVVAPERARGEVALGDLLQPDRD